MNTEAKNKSENMEDEKQAVDQEIVKEEDKMEDEDVDLNFNEYGKGGIDLNDGDNYNKELEDFKMEDVKDGKEEKALPPPVSVQIKKESKVGLGPASFPADLSKQDTVVMHPPNPVSIPDPNAVEQKPKRKRNRKKYAPGEAPTPRRSSRIREIKKSPGTAATIPVPVPSAKVKKSTRKRGKKKTPTKKTPKKKTPKKKTPKKTSAKKAAPKKKSVPKKKVAPKKKKVKRKKADDPMDTTPEPAPVKSNAAAPTAAVTEEKKPLKTFSTPARPRRHGRTADPRPSAVVESPLSDTYTPTKSDPEDEDFTDKKPTRKRKRKTQKGAPRGKRRKTGGPPNNPLGLTCTCCGVAHSAQWRRGPTGSKTLCNACGLRWHQGKIALDQHGKLFNNLEGQIKRAWAPLTQEERNRLRANREETKKKEAEKKKRDSLCGYMTKNGPCGKKGSVQFDGRCHHHSPARLKQNAKKQERKSGKTSRHPEKAEVPFVPVKAIGPRNNWIDANQFPQQYLPSVSQLNPSIRRPRNIPDRFVVGTLDYDSVGNSLMEKFTTIKKKLIPENGPFSSSILLHIFSFFDPKSTSLLSSVCYLWEQAFQSPYLWQVFYDRSYPIHMGNLSTCRKELDWKDLYRVRHNVHAAHLNNMQLVDYLNQFYIIENNPRFLKLIVQKTRQQIHYHHGATQKREEEYRLARSSLLLQSLRTLSEDPSLLTNILLSKKPKEKEDAQKKAMDVIEQKEEASKAKVEFEPPKKPSTDAGTKDNLAAPKESPMEISAPVNPVNKDSTKKETPAPVKENPVIKEAPERVVKTFSTDPIDPSIPSKPNSRANPPPLWIPPSNSKPSIQSSRVIPTESTLGTTNSPPPSDEKGPLSPVAAAQLQTPLPPGEDSFPPQQRTPSAPAPAPSSAPVPLSHKSGPEPNSIISSLVAHDPDRASPIPTSVASISSQQAIAQQRDDLTTLSEIGSPTSTLGDP